MYHAWDKIRYTNTIYPRKLHMKGPFEKPIRRWDNNIKMDLR